MRTGTSPFMAVVLVCMGVLLTGCPCSLCAKDALPGEEDSSVAVRSARAPRVLWVDFSYTGSDSNGTEARPYLNLTQAVNAAASGDTIRIKGGSSTTSSPEALRITKLSRIEASGGAVTVGDESTNALVPNVVNMTQAAAQSAITAAGLTPGTVTQQYHDTIPSGRVISQNPIAGRIVALGNAVALTVSNGPAPTPPTVTSFAVNNGAAFTATQAVTLNNTCTGSPTQYMASESSSFAGATWKTYAAAPSFTLSAGNGAKTVYFKAKNAGGESLSITDTIVLNQITTDTVTLPGGVSLTMVWIPGGTFLMGRYAGEYLSEVEEDPQHQVTVPGFWLGESEVTQTQWQALMGANPSYFAGANRPVEQVSWDDARSFITALNAHTGQTYRLPSEAQWEYACRAGTTTRHYWGDDTAATEIGAYAWNYNNSGDATHDVRGRDANVFGLYDMNGNVYELCEDDWHDNYTGAPVNGSAWVDTPRASWRVARGGGYNALPNRCRSASRGKVLPANTSRTTGFRVAR